MRPQTLTGVRLISIQLTERRALKHKVSRCGKHTAVPRMHIRHTPDLTLRDRIPRSEMAGHTLFRRGFYCRVLRQTACIQIDADVPCELARCKALWWHKRKAHLGDRDVHQFRDRAV